MKIREIPLDAINGSVYQPRRQEDRDILDLAHSIRVNGLRIPIVVREKEPGSYAVLCGHRRLKAIELLQKKGVTELPTGEAKLGGEEPREEPGKGGAGGAPDAAGGGAKGATVNALVFDHAGEKAAVLTGFLDNYVRCDLSPFEQATCYREFVLKRGFERKELAARLGIDDGTLDYMIAALDQANVPADMIASWKDRKLVLGHVVCLVRLRAHPARQRELYRLILEEEIPVGDARSLCAQALADPTRPVRDQRHEKLEQALLDSPALAKYLKKKWIKVERSTRGERVDFRFSSLDEFKKMLRETIKAVQALEPEAPTQAAAVSKGQSRSSAALAGSSGKASRTAQARPVLRKKAQ